MYDTDAMRTATVTFLAVGQVLFALLYCTFPWWDSLLGRALFFKAAIFAVVLAAAAVSRNFPTHWWDEFFTVMYLVLGLGVWLQLLAFSVIKVESMRAKRESLNDD